VPWLVGGGAQRADAVGVSLYFSFPYSFNFLLLLFLYILYYISLCLGVPNERSLKCIDTKRTTLSERNAYCGEGKRGGGFRIATDNGNNGS